MAKYIKKSGSDLSEFLLQNRLDEGLVYTVMRKSVALREVDGTTLVEFLEVIPGSMSWHSDVRGWVFSISYCNEDSEEPYAVAFHKTREGEEAFLVPPECDQLAE